MQHLRPGQSIAVAVTKWGGRPHREYAGQQLRQPESRLRGMVWRAACGVLLAMAASGCTGDPEDRSGPMPSAEATPLAVTSEVLGPDGLGPLTLGMSAEAARASGRIECVSAHCATYALTGLDDAQAFSGCISDDLGVMAIFAPPEAATPEGVRNGMPVEQAIEAYPDAAESVNGWSVPVPGHEGRSYSWLSDDGSVAELALSLDVQNCFG